MNLRSTHACLLGLCSLTGCADDPAVTCPAGEAVRVFAYAGASSGLLVAHSGDHAYYLLDGGVVSPVVAIGRRCGDADFVIRGASLLPSRLHLDPQDDDPSIACNDGDGRFYSVDVAGERAPTLLLPHLSCRTTPTAHGPLIMEGSGPMRSVRLFPDFPDEASSSQILIADQFVQFAVLGDVVVYNTDQSTLRRHDLVTGDDVELTDRFRYTYLHTSTHVLWYGDADELLVPVFLLEVATGRRIQLGTFDLGLNGPYDPDPYPVWSFDAAGEHVVHAPGDPAAQAAAFDLDGRPRPFPAPGKLVSQVLPGGGFLSVTSEDLRLHHTRIGAEASTALDHVYPAPYARTQFRDAPFHARLEFLVDDDLHAVPLDGSPAVIVARDVGSSLTWLDEQRLLIHDDERLVVLHVPSGARTTVADGVDAFQSAGDLLVDGLYTLVADDSSSEVWYLPPALLLAGP